MPCASYRGMILAYLSLLHKTTMRDIQMNRIVLGLVGLVFSTFANATLIVNGSLTGSLGNGVVPASWTISSPSPDTNDVANAAGGGYPYAVTPSGPSPDGGTWVGIARDGDFFVESFAQIVAGFTLGTEYELSWSAANFGFSGYTASNSIEALIDGVSIGTGALLSLGPDWTAESLLFTATAATHELAFRLASTSKSYLQIDGINLEPSGDVSVPAPATLLLFGLGLAGLGLSRRKKA